MRKTPIALLGLIFVIAVLHSGGHADLFPIGSLWWFDALLHILGGVWVAMAFGYLLREKFPIFREGTSRFAIWCLALASVALIGTFWEFYEYVVWQWSGNPIVALDIHDTLADLTDDLIGGFVGTIIYEYCFASP